MLCKQKYDNGTMLLGIALGHFVCENIKWSQCCICKQEYNIVIVL